MLELAVEPHWLWTALGTLAHLLVVVGFLLVERRQPAATLAWVVVLIFVPYVGIAAYFMFGPPRRVRRARIHARIVNAPRKLLGEVALDLRAGGAADVQPYALSVMRLAQRLSGSPVTLGNNLQPLVDAAATYAAIGKAIAAAEHHIHLLYYIYREDGVGTRLRDALIERARAGVYVRVLLDAVGSAPLRGPFWSPRYRRFFEDLLKAGGQVHFYGRPGPLTAPLSRFGNADRLDFRNHRKVVIVDGAVGFVGGINIGDEYLSLDSDLGAWRDTHARLVGPEVLALQATFAGDWQITTGAALQGDRYFPAQKLGPGTAVQVMPSGPDRRWSPLLHVFVQAITLAEKRVCITSPYFIPEAIVQQSLQSAALRGVDVRLLLPSVSDNRIVRWASQSYYRDLLEAGVQIYEYQAGFLHAKTMVVDDWFATIGSANVDLRSFHLNYEIGALAYDAAICEQVAAQFERDIERSKRIRKHDIRRLAVPQRLIRGVSRLLSPLL